MERQKKKQKGITLIALVISIIVMLILAGVSLNMTIGDNGIISQAQEAKYQMSIAVLEEFLNEKYIENYDEVSNIDSNKSPLERIIELYSNWFYVNGINDYVLKEYTYKDESGENQSGYIKIRLIRKNNLPREIREQLVGGDAIGLDGTSDNDYAYDNLKDVYGVTGDLKVFYCSEGLDSYIGAYYASSGDKDGFDGNKIIYDSNSILARALAQSNGDVETKDWSMQDLKTIKELTIDGESGLTNLVSLADLPNITKLTLSNYKGSLTGIEKAYKITSITFNNTLGEQAIDYVGLSKVIWLKELYFKNPNNNEVQKLFTEMSKTDYSSLTTLGLYGGLTSYGNDSGRTGSYPKSSFTNIMPDGKEHLSLLTNNTKSKITSLYLGGNNISKLDVSGYTGVSNLYLNHNNFINVPTLKNGNYNHLDLGVNNLSSFSLPAEVMVTGKLYLDSNTKLTSLLGLLNHGITWCVATGIPNFDFSTLTQDQRTELSKIRIDLDSSYALVFPTNVTIVPISTTDEQFKNQIKNATVIKTLSISGCKNLKNETIQEVLATLNLNKLNADDTSISSLNCLSGSDLNALSIRNTSISDFTPIINKSLGLLRLTNVSEIINYYNSQNDTYKTNLKNFFNRIISSNGGGSCIKGFVDGYGSRGLCITSMEDMANLINIMGITNIIANYENNKCNGNFNISSSKVTNLVLDYSSNLTKVVLPVSITYLELERPGCTVEVPSKSFSLHIHNTIDFPLKLTSVDNSKETIINSAVIRGQTPDVSWKNIRINELQLNAYNYCSNNYGYKVDASRYNSAVNLDCLKHENMTSNVGVLRISNVKYSSLSELDKFTTTTEVYSWCNGLNSIGDFLEKNTEITTLYLNQNSLNCLDGLENGTKLQRLDLSSNVLENQYTSKITGKTVNTSATIANLPNLTWVNLSGNTYYTDFKALEEAGFINNGNNIFTRNLEGNK